MKYTKGELAQWLRAELVDLVNDIAKVRKSDMPEFNQGIDIICAYDTKVEKILKKLAVQELYEALKEFPHYITASEMDADQILDVIREWQHKYWQPAVEGLV